MRIDAYNQVAQAYGVQKTYNTQKANKSASMGSDQLSISQAGYSYQTASPFFLEIVFLLSLSEDFYFSLGVFLNLLRKLFI